MSAQDLDWVLIHKTGNAPIGAIGFLGDDVVALAAFYEADAETRSVMDVASRARIDLDIIKRDGKFANMANQLYLNFVGGLLHDGIHAAYFSRGVRMEGRGVARRITSGAVKELMVRKGFQKSVKEAFRTAAT